ncbi:carboxypeptidase regulatory-like domain-containing protein [Parabacteroides sp.]
MKDLFKRITAQTLLLLSLVCGLAACTEEEPDLFGNVHGYVSDEATGEPIRTASVTINPGGKKTVTGSDGRFEYQNLEAGQYTLQIAKDGYQTNVGNVTVVPGQTAQCDILLHPGDGYLKVNKTEINMGYNNNMAAFEISNTGKIDLQWSIKEDCEWITEIEPAMGTTAAGKKSSVTVKIDRSLLEKGKTSSYSIVITSNAGAAEITILASGEGATDNPNSPDKPENPETPDNPDTPDTPSTGDITAGLMAYYNFNHGDAKDATDNKINGTLINAPEFTDKTISGTGKALFINGTLEQYVNIPYNPFKGKNTYTISLWVKDFGSGLILSAISSNVTEHYPAILCYQSGKFALSTGYYDHYQDYPFSFLYKQIQDGQWHMLTFVVTPNTDTYTDNDCMKSLYIDGSLVDCVTGNAGSNGGTIATKMQIGGNGDGKYDSCGSFKIDNIRFYDRALEASEIESLYNYEKAN